MSRQSVEELLLTCDGRSVEVKRAALNAIKSQVERETLERAAKVCDRVAGDVANYGHKQRDAAGWLARKIRELGVDHPTQQEGEDR